jgi:formimidoylglutamate deiminase
MSLHFAHALLPSGWARDVRVSVKAGRITTLRIGVAPSPGDDRRGVGVPGLANLHSHAFQRGMAGLSEWRGSPTDTFWSWREVMYRFALTLTPDEMEAIAAHAAVEMLEAGFTVLGEFHYLHHAQDGRLYDDPAEMAGRIVAAADTAGIGLTLLPVFYAHANFNGAPPTEGQRRFISSVDGYRRLIEASRQHLRPGDGFGIAPHSLRAVTADELKAILPLAKDAPVHIHAAEQVREVADCLAATGARPVEWLIANAGVDARWCLIHATHLTERETTALAATGAVAGLCPVTEANLGDGVFPTRAYLNTGGKLGVGTDSNIAISAAQELRQLEYAQRLTTRERNVLADPDPGASTATTLWRAASVGGAAALGQPGGLAIGARADIVALDLDHPALIAAEGPRALDALVFATTGGGIRDVWCAGRHVVRDGRHVARDPITARYRAVMEAVKTRL